jgi:hypothetical protein
MSATLDSAAVADLAAQVSGSVLGPQDAGYEAARAVHNGFIDRRPALIVRSRTTNDVLTEMKGIAVDPDRATATAEVARQCGNVERLRKVAVNQIFRTPEMDVDRIGSRIHLRG